MSKIYVRIWYLDPVQYNFRANAAAGSSKGSLFPPHRVPRFPQLTVVPYFLLWFSGHKLFFGEIACCPKKKEEDEFPALRNEEISQLAASACRFLRAANPIPISNRDLNARKK